MNTKTKKNIQSIICSVLIIGFVLSTLLIFLIPTWIVLIINACEIVLFRIIFRYIHIRKKLFLVLYTVACCICVGIMILIMFYPTKICAGILNNSSAIKSPEVVHDYHFKMGIMMLIFVLHYIITGIVCGCMRYNNVQFAYFLSILLASMGGLIIANCPDSTRDGLNWTIAFGVIYVAIIDAVQIYLDYFSYGGGSSGGSGDDTYHVIIFKD